MLVWKGAGYVVPVLAFASLLATEISVERWFADDRYYQHHGWPKLVGLALAAVLVFASGHVLKRPGAKTWIEKDTGREIVVRPEHTFFFIDVQHWGYVLMVLAVVFSFVRTA